MKSLRVISSGHDGRILSNINVWDPTSEWLLWDTRSDAKGDLFDGNRIMRTRVATGESQCLYLSTRGANCGVATYHPQDDRVVFIHGPENPTQDWQYGPSHRQGRLVDVRTPFISKNLDARHLSETPKRGALRGGTHVHVWHPQGCLLSSTYNDAMVESSIRDIAIHVPGFIDVPVLNVRNHIGTYTSFIVSGTVTVAQPGSDDITRAYEEGWLGNRSALAFIGDIRSITDERLSEVYIADVSNITSDSTPSMGTNGRIAPPKGVTQRRLTHTTGTGSPRLVQQPRHWIRSCPAGDTVAAIMADRNGMPQVHTIDVKVGTIHQRTHIAGGVSSALSWSPDGTWIAVCAGNDVMSISTDRWSVQRIGHANSGEIMPLCCCISPNSKRVACLIREQDTNHIAILDRS